MEVLEDLAEGYASIHDWQEADFYLTVLIAKKPREAKYYFERGRVRQVVPDGQGHDKAVADYRETLVRSPKHFEAQLGLAQCLLSDAHLDSAQREFETCRDINPRRTEPLIGLAICAVEEEDLQKAQELLTEALNYEPDSVTALAMLGDLRLRRQEYKEAILYFQKVVALDPANKAAHLKLAQAFRSSGKAVEAKNQEDAYQRLERMRNKNSSRPR